MAGDPIDGEVLLITAAKASVTPSHLPDVVDRAQAHLGPRFDDYRRRYECVHETDELAAFLVEEGHWAELCATLGFAERECDAVERAHTEQLRRIGRHTDRGPEFETALELREVVVVGR